jgi:uncharacterized RDD family membrane protein YckC
MTNAPPPPPNWGAAPTITDGTAPYGYGGFWLRVVAYIIDGVVLNIATWIIALVAGVDIFAGGTSNLALTTNGISLVISWLYFALMESSERGATLGKMALSLRVVTENGQRLSFANATGRFFAKIVSALILGIGFIMVGFTDRKRGLHDMMASTLVVKVR